MLNKYEVNWFDHGDWHYHTDIILAESEEQARNYADSQCIEEYRSRPYHNAKEDSLRIEVTGREFNPTLCTEGILMAEKICDDSDQNFDYASSIYLSKDGNTVVLEVEGRETPGLGKNIEHIYLSPENCQLLINRLTVYLND